MNIFSTLNSYKIFEEEIFLKRNEYLKFQNTVDTNIYFIKSGSLKISIMNGFDEQIIRFGYDHNIIVALDSFISNGNSEYIIQAIKKTHVLVAKKKDFIEFINLNKENSNFYIQLLEELILQQLEREKDLLLESPKERYETVLKRSPQLFQFVPHKFIANYLRMSPETLSRLKKS